MDTNLLVTYNKTFNRFIGKTYITIFDKFK